MRCRRESHSEVASDELEAHINELLTRVIQVALFAPPKPIKERAPPARHARRQGARPRGAARHPRL